jgi:hypothetical protein
MAAGTLTEEEVLIRLEAAIEAAGSARQLAQRIGVCDALICDQRKRKREVTGRVARFLKLKRIRTVSVIYVDIAA